MFQLRETGKFNVRLSTKVLVTNFFSTLATFFSKLVVSWYWWDSGFLEGCLWYKEHEWVLKNTGWQRCPCVCHITSAIDHLVCMLLWFEGVVWDGQQEWMMSVCL